jgi:short subunit dehydrogenase-like uncharacterized protein
MLAGRNLDKVKRVAEPLGLSARAFDLGDPARIDAAIKDVSVVLCAAGSFSTTSRPVADACLRNRVHYLDITGEIDVFEALAARDAEGKARGVMLLPGVGFDVAPSDCSRDRAEVGSCAGCSLLLTCSSDGVERAGRRPSIVRRPRSRSSRTAAEQPKGSRRIRAVLWR